ncbi:MULTISPECIES: LysR family transcriptional regulator [unclassified Roseofilum]|uniref:LysR family transcriptional regulator n=1 Tax=unclassified Roseofilum TaxID=2620099 RepID=UPI000E83B2EA|nr:MULTISPECIES: LysR family transcriptional regulator [unclassified Roseofilum]HBR00947.1 LysR family transcriptional regulator [Cyanobacteria bacterium UBA11691]MBP0010053.1 LysR family transcriptional regulator [Roseofilum sp. Belize Diploria]MBP0012714.1 LysR family transcriptional regulator [Roseofilum sp. SID3]MBP0023015.1 LysR family transcriptional regulator [Roseofilum sp. SID2]MBP0032249.1 LysR family transcriptional regulator [Roseofilum sp. Belize BBD 4]
MDKFESIHAFTQVVEEGSFAAAARKMQLSRSAVNKLVIALEKYLGVPLLYRTTRQVTLTDNGQAFYERCLDILHRLEEAEFSISEQQTEPKGNLKINAPMSFGLSFLSAKIAEFMTQYKQVKIQLTLEDRFVDPIAEGYDLVIRISLPLKSPSLIAHPITTIPRVICAAPSYLNNRGIPTEIEDLKKHSCMHYGYLATGERWPFIYEGEEGLISIDGVFCSNNGEVLRDAAVNGLGIVMLPNFIVEQDLRKGNLQVLLSNYKVPELTLYVVYPISSSISKKVKLFTQFMQQALDEVKCQDSETGTLKPK